MSPDTNYHTPPGMTMADAPKLPTPDPADSRIVDLLAFSLLSLQAFDETVVDPVTSFEELVREKWQSSTEERTEWRQDAKSLISKLEDMGLRIRSSDARRVAVQTEWIRTVPPRAAYAEDEIA